MPHSHIWTDPMVNVLLNHVETEKGDTGLYLKDRIAAYEAAAKIVTESFPNQPMTTQQVKSKIYYMIRGSRHVSKEVFRNGRCLLDPSDNDASESDTEDHTSRMSPQNMDTSMDELNEEVPAESPRATLEPGPRSQDLSLSLHSGQRQAPQDAEAALPTGNLQDELAVGTHALAPRVNSLVPQAMKSQMPHSGVPLSVFNYPGVRGQVDRPAARSSGQMYTSSWRAAPMDTDATRQRLVVIREYLADHPDQYIPSHEDIKNQKFILVRQTITVVMNLLRSKKPPYAWQRYNALDYKSPPNFYEALLEPNFRQMCKRMYGVGTEKELYKKMDESSLDMTEFLRAFLAATITDWVFKEQVVSMPKVISDRTGPPLVFEKEARKVSEELYEQILRKCRIDYIKNEANFKDVARSLSWRLRELLKHFLGSNSLPNTGQDWDDDLAGMFLNALMLKAKITVLSGRYDFRAPALDDLFNGKTMEVEERAATREGWTVLIAFFPALVRILEPPSGMEDGKEVTIVPATVLLQ